MVLSEEQDVLLMIFTSEANHPRLKKCKDLALQFDITALRFRELKLTT